MTPDAARRFDRLLARWQRQRRLGAGLQGLVWALAVMAVFMFAASVLLSASYFAPLLVDNLRILSVLVALVALITLVVARTIRRASPMETALHVENQSPDLDALLVSAVSARDAPAQTSPDLSRELLDRAVTAAGERNLARSDRRRSLTALTALVVLAVAAALVVSFGPPWLRHSLSLLVNPSDAQVANPFTFVVKPGDAEVAAGDDQLVIASAHGFAPESVTLFFRADGEADWQSLDMQGDREDFTGYLRNIEVARDYYVQAGGTRSGAFRIEVVRRPELERIDLVYHFPDYTGREPMLITDGGDVRVPKGTRVEVRVHARNAERGGQLVLDGEQPRPFTGNADSGLGSEFTVERNGRYRVELAGEDSALVAVSPEYAIEALPDQLPSIALLQPGRDARVSSLEEVEIGIDAVDDIGVRDIELVMSVNGEDEETLPVPIMQTDQREVRESLVLYLEERQLTPGDLIAYYARARDALAGTAGRDVSTDIYFMEVRPFEREFRQARSQGGGGGGGEQQQEQLAAQQRMLVVALFNAVRDRQVLGEEEYGTRLESIGEAQGRIRARVDAIIRRLKSRSIVQLDPGYQQMTRELPKASIAMGEVVRKLDHAEGKPAQVPARKALLHLQRAEAAFRSVQVSRGDTRGGGSGDLRDLFRLEMDRFRNQYADVQRGRWQADPENIEKTLDALRELARRQQREIERNNRRGDGEGSDSQRALAEEVERMARELERLSLTRPELAKLARQLREAAESMRAAASGEGDSNSGSRAALRQLREARRALDEARHSDLNRGVQESLRNARALENEQQEIGNRIGDAREDAALREQLAERKQAMLERLEQLREELARLSGEARERPAVRRDLREAERTMRERALQDNISASRRRLLKNDEAPDEFAEQEIGAGLRAARESIEAAAGGLAPSQRERSEQAREQLRDVVRGLDTLTEASGADQRSGGFGGGDDRGRGRPDNDPVNVAEALRAQVETLRGLRGGLHSPKTVGDVDAVIEGLIGLADGYQPGAATSKRQAELLDALKQVEYELRDQESDDPPLIATPEAQPAVEHRELVESYYRALSEQ